MSDTKLKNGLTPEQMAHEIAMVLIGNPSHEWLSDNATKTRSTELAMSAVAEEVMNMEKHLAAALHQYTEN